MVTIDEMLWTTFCHRLSGMHDTGTVTARGTLGLGRAAMARRSWSEAYQLFSAADADVPTRA